MQEWHDFRRPVITSFIAVKSLCQIVLDYAYELQGVPYPMQQPQNMAHIWLVANLPHGKFATALITDEVFVWGFGQASGGHLLALMTDLHDMVAWHDMLVTATQDSVRAWDTSTRECLSTLFVGTVDLLTVSNDLLLMGTFGGEIMVLDGMARVCMTFSHGSAMVRMFGLSDRMVAVCDGHKISLYRINANGFCLVWSAPSFYHMTSHLDAMVAAYGQGVVRVWQKSLTMDIDCQATALCALHGQKVAVACSDHAVGFYDLLTRCYTPLTSVGTKMIVTRLVELPDGRLAGYTDRCIVVWDLQTKQHVIWPRPCYPTTTFKIAKFMLLICYDLAQNRLHVLQ